MIRAWERTEVAWNGKGYGGEGWQPEEKGNKTLKEEK